MSPARPRALIIWIGLLLLGAAAAVTAAEFSGSRLQIYCGAAGGLLLGLCGHLFAARAVRSAPGRGDTFWPVWGLGVLVRFLMLSGLALVFWLVWREHFAPAMLSMAAAYLTAHCAEISWLWRQARPGAGRYGAAHG